MDHPHWITMCICSLCEETPQSVPMFECPLQHPYCEDCFNSLKTSYRGSIPGGCTCIVCNVSGKFQKMRVSANFLNKLKYKPPVIQSPFHYNNVMSTDAEEDGSVDMKVTVEKLFNLPKNKVDQLLNNKPLDSEDEETFMDQPTPSLPVLKPFRCPDDKCGKWLAPSSFVNHFNCEHNDVPKYSIERDKELKITCDVENIEYNTSRCLGLITVYEINKIDVNKSRSSKTVIKTCNKFSQKIPLNTFYLMESAFGLINDAYISYWLFNSTKESYPCTIELTSAFDLRSVASFFHINPLNHCDNYIKAIQESPNGLILCRQSIIGLLEEGTNLNLRITVH